ncbi:MAG: hypothetical protein C0606_04095 [Hyphomicrobiales bacterium]|nr:MAG: hypothetical protein C0606_04095 [Hyphomicrobiales bacterium]
MTVRQILTWLRQTGVRTVIASVLLTLFVVAVPVAGETLGGPTFFGLPFTSYFAAQGSLLVCVVLVFWLAARQSRGAPSDGGGA